MDLYWIDEAARPPQSDDEKIEVAVYGERKGHSVAFHDYAVHDAEATERLGTGRLKFRNAVYVAVRVKGETDFASRPADENDKRRFPVAWADYLRRKEGPVSHRLELLPQITAAELRELAGLKVRTIEQLIEAPELYEHEHWRAVARRILSKPRVRLVNGQFQEVA